MPLNRVQRLVGAVLFTCVCLPAVAAADPVHITFMHWGSGESYANRYKALIADFEAQNPDIVIDELGGLDSPVYETKLNALIAGGTAPDVFMADMEFLSTYADRAVDLTPFAKADTGFHLSEISPSVVRIFTVDGKLVGFPHDVSPNLYYYNADLFNAAGIELPADTWKRDAWTWAAFEADAKKLTKTDAAGKVAVYGAQVATGQSLGRLFMWSNNAPEVDDIYNPKRSLYDQPNAIEAIDFIQRLHTQDRVAEPNGAKQDFPNGDIALWARWSSGITSFADVPFKWGIAPYPKGPAAGGRYASDVGTAGFIVDKSTKHPQEAWRLVAYLAGPSAAKIIGKMGPGIPIRPGARITSFPKNLLNPDDVYAIAALPDNGNGVRILSANHDKLNGVVDEVWPKILTGQIAAKAGAQEIAQRQNALISQ
ncbi:MAG TPA: sugar ABC transporter substrate-binding protein [Limnochordia bacterium]|nr:sugar ABC transporter substrate-binding protein [Limnochordia bacterium]